MQFSETVDPQVDTEKVQQTPKPAAQFPSAVPLLPEHSDDVKHVPLISSEDELDFPVHWLKNNKLTFQGMIYTYALFIHNWRQSSFYVSAQ